ncbi:helix-turn-helix domain-containing protein [Cellulosimicrobium funkei]|uniref:helix-turn-helix domain-containing protein n=1 Tax=Cellulosimicrobium funkei TaxID=264251 RepID=UPI0034307727
MLNPMMTVEAASQYLDVQPLTIRRYIARGTLPAYRIGPKLVRVRVSDLDRLVTPIGEAA